MMIKDILLSITMTISGVAIVNWLFQLFLHLADIRDEKKKRKQEELELLKELKKKIEKGELNDHKF